MQQQQFPGAAPAPVLRSQGDRRAVAREFTQLWLHPPSPSGSRPPNASSCVGALAFSSTACQICPSTHLLHAHFSKGDCSGSLNRVFSSFISSIWRHVLPCGVHLQGELSHWSVIGSRACVLLYHSSLICLSDLITCSSNVALRNNAAEMGCCFCFCFVF